MARRLFFVDRVRGQRAQVEGDDAAHLTRVLRAEIGQRLEISDNDNLYLAEIEEARRDRVVFRVIERLERAGFPVRPHLYAALIKFEHFEWMLEKTTELGVETITPVVTARSEKGLERAALKRLDRWRRIVRESSQQCRRARLPEVCPPARLEEALGHHGLRLLLDETPGAPPLLSELSRLADSLDRTGILVGPEGGWTDAERGKAAAAGWTAVSLGPGVLRTETAAMAALAVLTAFCAAAKGSDTV